jgi:uncharacterized protein
LGKKDALRALQAALSTLQGLTQVLLLGLVALPVSAADLAVVIDDVGYNVSRGLRAVTLPAPVTIAVLPFAPHTQFLARQATRAGKDLIIHQPMEPVPSTHARYEIDTLTSAMGIQEFDATVERALHAIPQTLGFSNHTGSYLTTQYDPMRRFMRHLSRRGLFFLDSRTTAETITDRVADELGVTLLKRDVFLDHDRSISAIAKAFQQAIRIARRRGYAVLVAHPYPVSLSFLESALLETPADINLVGIATHVAKRQAAMHQAELVLQSRPSNLRISLGQ